MTMNRAVPAAAPPPERLRLIDAARQTVLNDGALAPWIEPWIDRSWRRCLQQGLQPRQRLNFQAVSATATRQALEASQSLRSAAAPVIRSLARTMADTQYFAILTNAQGVVIEVNGPIDRHDPQAALIARIGVDLSEAAVGTTAIGATLAEQQPVWLHRGEHFFDDAGVYSCAGAPVFGPDGRCVGMLDLTGVNVPERPALKHLVTQSARSIENAMALARPHELLLRITWPGCTPADDSDGLVCVDADGMITGSNRTAATMLGLVSGMPPMHCSDVFAVPTGSLFDMAAQQRAAAELPLWSGLRMQVVARQGQHHRPAAPQAARANAQASVPLKDVETAMIRQAVQDARGNVMEAARALGISRATVYRKLMRRKPGS